MLYVSPETRIRLRQAQHCAEERERRCKAATSEPKQKLGRKRRNLLASLAMRILDAGAPTKFEYEAACRHGLRVSLILQGWRWGDADHAAEEVVGLALEWMGVERPSWIDGQPEAAANVETARHYCARCCSPIPDERKATGRAKYCSQLCTVAASLARARVSGERVSRAEWLAQCADKSAATVRDLTKACERCGTTFIAERHRNRFCGYACANSAAWKHDERACAHCQTMFRPIMKRSGKLQTKQLQKFCSRPCSDAGRKKDWGFKRAARLKCEEVS